MAGAAPPHTGEQSPTRPGLEAAHPPFPGVQAMRQMFLKTSPLVSEYPYIMLWGRYSRIPLGKFVTGFDLMAFVLLLTAVSITQAIIDSSQTLP